MNIKAPSFLRGWTPAVLWMAIIFTLSSIKGDDLPKVPVPDLNSVAHALEYSILGILLFRGWRQSFPENTIFLLALLAAISAILFGISDEWHQTFVSGRVCDLADLIVDAVSAVLGILLYIRTAGFSSLKK